jgi:hypothetical protein
MRYPIQNDDPNLSYVVTYKEYGNFLEIEKNANSQNQVSSCLQNPAGCIGFQAGPLVLSGNILQDFGDSWHA